MRVTLWVIMSSSLLVGCAVLPDAWQRKAPAPSSEGVSEEASVDGEVVGPPPPPPGARTVEAFDTTTDAERAAAVTGPSGQERRLGTTIASLGDVSETGLWMKTPLVDASAKGRVLHGPTGTSVAVDLLPLEGDAGAGSQLSLAAMRLLDVGLTDLPEVEVFRTGN